MKRIIPFFIIALLLGSMMPVLGQQYNGVGVGLKKLGQSTMNFLQVGVIPRASGLGDAYSAVGTGSHSIFYNPAALPEIDGTAEAFVSTTQWIADINYMAGAAALNLKSYGAIGIHFIFVDYGDIIGTRLLPYDQYSVDSKGYEETGMVDNVGAYSVGLSYARRISQKFLMGGTMKYVGQGLGRVVTPDSSKEDFGENKLAFDMGVKYYTGLKGFRFGMSIRNFATHVKYEEITTQLPLTFAVGAAIDVMEFFRSDESEGDDLLLTAEFIHPNNYTERVLVGLEYSIMNMLAIRGGYISNHDVLGFNAGIGLTPEISGKKIVVDYSYSSSISYFDDISRFSIGFVF
ncbi:PorV/PorQ family protein [bacterium]|nr:PorV/PorQ family protein [bacterium]